MWVFNENGGSNASGAGMYSEMRRTETFDCLKMFTPNSVCDVNYVRVPAVGGVHMGCGVDVHKVLAIKDSDLIK